MTLSRYILRGFLRWVLAVFAVIALVIILFTSVENLRRFGESGANGWDVLHITLLQAPEVLYQVFPLVLMLASLITFLRFARTSELVVMRAAGIAALRLISVPVCAAARRSPTTSPAPARACSPSRAKASGCARPIPAAGRR